MSDNGLRDENGALIGGLVVDDYNAGYDDFKAGRAPPDLSSPSYDLGRQRAAAQADAENIVKQWIAADRKRSDAAMKALLPPDQYEEYRKRVEEIWSHAKDRPMPDETTTREPSEALDGFVIGPTMREIDRAAAIIAGHDFIHGRGDEDVAVFHRFVQEVLLTTVGRPAEPSEAEVEAALNAWHPDMASIAPKMGGWSVSARDQMRAALRAAAQARAEGK